MPLCGWPDTALVCRQQEASAKQELLLPKDPDPESSSDDDAQRPALDYEQYYPTLLPFTPQDREVMNAEPAAADELEPAATEVRCAAPHLAKRQAFCPTKLSCRCRSPQQPRRWACCEMWRARASARWCGSCQAPSPCAPLAPSTSQAQRQSTSPLCKACKGPRTLARCAPLCSTLALSQCCKVLKVLPPAD